MFICPSLLTILFALGSTVFKKEDSVRGGAGLKTHLALQATSLSSSFLKDILMGTSFQKMKLCSSTLFDLEQNKYWILSFKMIDLKILLHEQAQLGLSHSEIQVELGCYLPTFWT